MRNKQSPRMRIQKERGKLYVQTKRKKSKVRAGIRKD